MAIKKRPVSPRQKMINLMYVVLMAMLALNVSNEVLNGFSLVEESLKRTTLNATKENLAIYDDFAVQMKKNPQKVQQWYDAGRIKKLDMYLGEIFPGSYKIEWQMVKKFYSEHPEAGRAAVFKNHSKIYAGCNEADNFYFGIQTSANINTNPRTEQGSIIVDRGLYEFYKEYFDSINSFEK